MESFGLAASQKADHMKPHLAANLGVLATAAVTMTTDLKSHMGSILVEASWMDTKLSCGRAKDGSGTWMRFLKPSSSTTRV